MMDDRMRHNDILYVDDDDAIRKFISKTLHHFGYNCTTASDSEEARSLLLAQPFNLVLCDIRMPGESGLELAHHIKTTYTETAVVMVTAIDDMDIAHQALSMDVYGYIVKPVNRNQILISVSNALRRRQLELKDKAYQKDLEHKIQERTIELKKTNDMLRKKEEELDHRMRELEAFNDSLEVLLRKREKDRGVIQERILANVGKFIKPSIERLRKKVRSNESNLRELQLLETGLDELVAPFVKEISSDFLGLTPNEIKVATLIKQGLSTKEIAGVLNLSNNTIMTHRYKIRTKLGIKNKRQSLQTYLKSLQSQNRDHPDTL